MNKIRDILIKIFNATYWLLFQYSKVVLVIIVIITCIQVFLRLVLNGGLRWSQEVSLLLVVWMTFLSMAIGTEKNLHISVGLFYEKMPKAMKKVCDFINDLMTLAVGVFLTIYGALLVKSTMNSTLAATKWPAGILYLMIPVGGICIFFFKLYDLFGWKKYKKTDEDEFNTPVNKEGE